MIKILAIYNLSNIVLENKLIVSDSVDHMKEFHFFCKFPVHILFFCIVIKVSVLNPTLSIFGPFEVPLHNYNISLNLVLILPCVVNRDQSVGVISIDFAPISTLFYSKNMYRT